MGKLFGNLEEFEAEPQQEKKQTATPEKIVNADEFDVCHSYVMTKSEYDQGVETSRKNLEDTMHAEIYFGTNEGIDVSGFDDYMRNISVQSITKEDYDAYMRMFGGEFGMISHYFPFGEDY